MFPKNFRSLFLSLGIGLMLNDAFAASPSDVLNVPGRFSRSATTELKISFDPQENAVRFDGSIKSGVKSSWCYPVVKLKKDEKFPATGVLRFEIRGTSAEQQPLKYDYALTIFQPGNLRFSLPRITPEWQTVTIDLKKLTDKPEDIHSFAIGINPRDPQFVYWVRNIQILDQVPPPTDSELIRQSMAWNQAKRFARSSSGELDISFDDKENAVRFDVNFNQSSKGNWCYPQMKLGKGEEIAPGCSLQFDFKAQAADGPVDCQYVLLILNPGNIRHSLPVPSADWQTVTIDLDELTRNPEEIQKFSIGLNPRNPQITYWLRNIRLRDTKKIKRLKQLSFISAGVPGAAYLQGEPLRFFLKNTEELNFPVSWCLNDWKGNLICSGSIGSASQSELTVPVQQNGYYRLHFTDKGNQVEGFFPFAVLPDPKDRRKNPDSYFSIDTAQSFFGRKNSDTLSELAYRAGMDIVRDRMIWTKINPQKGQYNWSYFLQNMETLQQRGISLVNGYHDAPKWARTRSHTLPDDLLDCYQFAKVAAQTCEGKVVAWEFWNEEDIKFCLEGAWDYAAAMKAAYLGFKAGKQTIPVLQGAFSNPRLPNYCHVVFANDVKDYMDIFNIHIYEPLVDYPSLAAGINRFRHQYGIAHLPFWLTESGCRMEGLGQADTVKEKTKAHTWDQELLVAEFIAKSMPLLQAQGASRNFFFVLAPHREMQGRKDWGLVRLDYTVKPSFSALTILKNQFDFARCEGTIDLGEQLRGVVYRQPDGTQSLLYWRLSSLDTGNNRYFNNGHTWDGLASRAFSVKAPSPIYRGIDLFGTPFEVQSQAGCLTLNATRMPAIIHGLSGLQVTTPATPAVLKKKNDSNVEDRTIVFRTVLSNDFELNVTKDSVDVKKDEAALTLQIWNLSEQAKTGMVTMEGCSIFGIPSQVSVPAFGVTELPLKLNSRGIDQLKVGGRFNGKTVSQLVMPTTNMRKMIDSGATTACPALQEAGRWRPNASGKMDIADDATEKAVRFHTLFPENIPDYWIYPEFVLKPGESFRDVIGIVFDIKVDKPDQVTQMILMQVEDTMQEHGKFTSRKFTVPANDQWEQRIVTLETNINPQQNIRMLRIGLNTSAREITYWIRNARLIHRTK